MKKRFFALLLVLALALPFPAIAAEEDTGFVDVSPGDWFAPYVEACVEAGLMEGTGDGQFSPKAYLTVEEAFVLVMRLHNLQQGGSTVFGAPPPEVWGTARLTYEDGTSLFLQAGQMGMVGSHSGSWYTANLSPEDTAVAVAHLEQPATLTDLATHVTFSACCFFQDAWTEDFDLHISGGYLPCFFASQYKTEWYGNALGYALEQGFFDPEAHKAVCSLIELVGHGWTLQRDGGFMEALSDVIGEVEKQGQIPALPDLKREGHEDIYRLYEAGILTGRNSSGTFDPYEGLTRAETAAMLARVLQPELRLSFPPISSPQ